MENKIKKTSTLKKVLFVFVLLILGTIIVFGFWVLNLKKAIERGELITPKMIDNYSPIQNSNTEISRAEIENSLEPSMGAKNPIMTIVEFGDFSCSKCKKFSPIVRQFVLDNSDKVKLIFRDFPILDTDLSITSIANCANYQGKFWQMHDKLYDYQAQENLTTSIKDELITELGLNKEVFDNCINNKEYQKDIVKDVTLATKLNLQVTPTNFINGVKIEGVITSDLLKQMLYNIENNLPTDKIGK